MLTKICKIFLSCISLIATLMLLVMCHKDNDNLGTSQRIKALNFYNHGNLQESAEIKYEGEKVSLINYTEYSYQTILGSIKTELAYPTQDSIIESTYYLDNDVWRPHSKRIIEFQNGLMMRITGTRPGGNGSWVDENKYEFLYNDINLQEVVHYLGGHLYDKTFYEYNGSRLLQALFYLYDDDWVLSSKDTLFYSGELIDSLINYSYENGTKHHDHKWVYLFELGLLKNVDIYKDDSTSWKYLEHYYFTYNVQGNITGRWNEIGESTYNYEYIYENGLGNYSQIYSTAGNLDWNFYCLPGPVKFGPIQF